jgi:UDP:flavonoid glycosyltransferase YjiC (YdhE family)
VRSLRILCTTQPGAGHLLPMVGLLRELQGRGHQVRVASAPSLGRLASHYGLPFAGVGPDFRVGDEPRLVPELARARARRDRSFPYTRAVLVETLARASLADTTTLVADWRPDVIVRDSVEFAGLVAAEAAGLPHAIGRDNRFLPPPTWCSELGDSLARLAQEAGAPHLDESALYRHLAIVPALPSFVTATADLPDPREFASYLAPTVRFIRPRTPSSDQPAAQPDRGAARAGVLCTFGTVVAPEARLWDTMRTAVRGLGRPFYGDVAPDGSMPWLDLAGLLPYCAAMVTVGGFNTVMEALRHGVPLVVIPVQADHPTNAARCAALGVGVALAPSEVSVASLTAAIEQVTSEPAYRARAADLAAEWQSLPDCDWAADRVEELAGRSR